MDFIEELKAFDDSIRANLGDFMARNGAYELVGKGEHDPSGSGLMTVFEISYEKMSKEPYVSWWVHRYDLGEIVIDLMFGDRESVFQQVVHYQKLRKSFGLWEILRASQNDGMEKVGGNLLEDVKVASEILIKNWSSIVSPSTDTIERATRLREAKG